MIKLWKYTEYNNWDSQRYYPLSSTLPESIWMIFTSEITQWGNVLLGCQYCIDSGHYHILMIWSLLKWKSNSLSHTYYRLIVVNIQRRRRSETRVRRYITWVSYTMRYSSTHHHWTTYQVTIHSETSQTDQISEFYLNNWKSLSWRMMMSQQIRYKYIYIYIYIYIYKSSIMNDPLLNVLWHIYKNNVSQHWFCKFWLKSNLLSKRLTYLRR